MRPRDLVRSTLEFRNRDGRVPRQLWTLPWAETRFPEELASIRRDFPDDIDLVPASHMRYAKPPVRQGDWYAEGRYLDEWGCTFRNIQAGCIGEVKDPVIPAGEDGWERGRGKVRIPEELLTLDKGLVDRYCAGTDRFVLAGELARPFERMQFIRGTEELYVDFALGNPAMHAFLEEVHDFYRRLLTVWAETDVDGLFFMDDWGSQRSLLMNPELWVRVFKPMYRDYADIAHSHGKKIFFHSDGYTLDIIPHLIDIGIDAANLQVFCIGPEKLRRFRGKISFWGEMDRQDMLVRGTREEVAAAVARVREAVWAFGGAIAQCEFGAGAKPGIVRSVFEAWAAMPGRGGATG